MRLWRIAAETRSYSAEDLSGRGAARYPGRWNDVDEAVVYAAPSIALAVLETAGYIDDGNVPGNRFVIELDVPDGVWASREALDVGALHPGWSAIPAGRASVKAGSAWLKSLRSPILLVPSVIVPEEQIALINPKHPGSAQITARMKREFDYRKVFRAKP
jgi:RES domain-containing protein